MKTPSSDLYDLIHSLRQSEKRYFRLYATKLKGLNPSKQYLNLFFLLNNQERFSEVGIRKKIADGKNFKRIKQYTTGMVLRSLENFHAESNAEIQLCRYLIQANVLFQKKQFSLLKKCLSKAIQLARERDMIQYIVPLVQMEFKSSISLKNTDHSLNLFHASELKKLSHDSWRWMELRRLDAMFWNLIHTKDSVGPKEKKQFRAIASKALGVYRSGKNGYAINREAANVLGLCYRFSGDLQKSYVWRKKVVEFVQNDKKFLNERSEEYVVAIGNLMNLCIEMQKDEEAEQLFQIANKYLNALPSKYLHPSLNERFCNLKNNYILFLFSSKRYEPAIFYGERLYEILRSGSEIFMNSLMPILLRTLVFSGFYTKNHKISNKYYRLWLSQGEPESDVIGRKLFGLVLLFDQGDKDLLYYRCRSLRYALKKTSFKNPFVTALEKFISGKLLKATGKQEEQLAFKTFYESVEKNKKVLAALQQAGPFNYTEWIKKCAKII